MATVATSLVRLLTADTMATPSRRAAAMRCSSASAAFAWSSVRRACGSSWYMTSWTMTSRNRRRQRSSFRSSRDVSSGGTPSLSSPAAAASSAASLPNHLLSTGATSRYLSRTKSRTSSATPSRIGCTASSRRPSKLRPSTDATCSVSCAAGVSNRAASAATALSSECGMRSEPGLSDAPLAMRARDGLPEISSTPSCSMVEASARANNGLPPLRAWMNVRADLSTVWQRSSSARTRCRSRARRPATLSLCTLCAVAKTSRSPTSDDEEVRILWRPTERLMSQTSSDEAQRWLTAASTDRLS
mmetsp:Transcript_3138/g.11249  ORF Transcript_3138/g.11249 Transcript_3138/m.11249 type:complete len:302 (-) Transcript_3138:1964-2869(-)